MSKPASGSSQPLESGLASQTGSAAWTVTALSDAELVRAVAQHLRARGGQTLSFAESCTGGLLSALVASFAGVSDIYLGSVIAYSNRMKEKVLHVPLSLLRTMGAVSNPVAREMAKGARDVVQTDWAVSITGIAGPGGGTPDKPVGTVCFAWIGPGIEKVERRQFEGTRTEIQKQSARYALETLLAQLGDSREKV